MSQSIALLGAGEHARMVADSARRADMSVAGCYAPGISSDLDQASLRPWLGDDAALAEHLQSGVTVSGIICAVVGAVGSTTRKRMLTYWANRAVPWLSVIDPSATVSEQAYLGPGVYVAPGAYINQGARIGAHAVINTGAIIEHDVEIGMGVHVAPGAVIGGGASIGDHAIIGLGARVRDHISIGADSVVGMAAAVVADVAAGLTVMGVPARPRRQSCPDPAPLLVSEHGLSMHSSQEVG